MQNTMKKISNPSLAFPPSMLSESQLVELCEELDSYYRSGNPQVSNTVFDSYYDQLKAVNPHHPFVNQPQAEFVAIVGAKGRIKHPEHNPMLSTDKAKSFNEVEKWLKSGQQAAKAIGLDKLIIRLTPKLDGCACRSERNNTLLVTRGEDGFGRDISHLHQAGLSVKANMDRQHDKGEIVIASHLFHKHFADKFADERAFVAGIVNSESLSQEATKALQGGMIELVVYQDIDGAIEVDDTIFVREYDSLIASIYEHCIYPMDGVVAEFVDPVLKERLGSCSHHHHWQVAIKQMGETAVTPVTSIRWTVGRTGVVVPTAFYDSVYLSNANLNKATLHHAQHVLDQQIGIGALIEITRSGSIIPTYLRTVKPVEPVLPTKCPCCASELTWDSVNLVCPNNLTCSAQASRKIQHHFKTIGVLGFGDVTCDLLANHGFGIADIYTANADELTEAGINAGDATNLVTEINRAITEPLEDTLLLASLGIHCLGKGNSRKLLAHYKITDLLCEIDPVDIEKISGFGDTSSIQVSADLQSQGELLSTLLQQGFHLVEQPLSDAIAEPLTLGSSALLSGLRVCFTGTMQQAKRSDMEDQARALGAQVQSNVNSVTDLLVVGDKAGSKLAKAQKLGVRILCEQEYNREFLI
ncbi:BRCT domain-containing protein [Motilimonas eburnea]|uniref:BRCT domain-containing protein n=1 Tax=Motilimonas eburnea TaxID=1737488 RepID=UPI001E299C6B|nr:BRCT domain-containing protein [Motilimonas eburnea]MCE2571733.1 hypothetical protein [Motilimonas eburnea]